MFNLIKKILNRLFEIFNYIISIWPSALGGIYIRQYTWSRFLRSCGKQVIFGQQIVVKGFSSINIGSNGSFMSGSFFYSEDEGQITVGDNCAFNHNVMLGASGGGKISIGNNVLIGPNVVIRACDHNFDDINKPIYLQGHSRGAVMIDDDVWIASNVVITKDVHIGKGVIIGAGSVVSHDLPEMTVCSGNPAIPIRSRLV
jgi:galactoside O-acetyltransferase|tara:strand:- start:582 stop:1181 length:600 start_codon:yes stop_codon:yes gene_type:complete